MKRNQTPIYYGDYLQLDKLLSAQAPESSKYGPTAHDETLFIVVHQVYELWFKQILHELKSVLDVFAQGEVKDQQLTTMVHRLKRVVKIQSLMNDQIEIMETMTPQDFLEFRDYLVPASGFQSIQFKVLEITLGLKRKHRIQFDQQSFYTRLSEEHRNFLTELEKGDSLMEQVDQWLARMPFLEMDGFAFWRLYQDATEEMMASDKEIIRTNPTLGEGERARELQDLENTHNAFKALFDKQQYEKLQEAGDVRLSHEAMLAALFIHQYREEPVFNLPYQFLTLLTDIDENMTLWRYRHSIMVHRMLGGKIGTGGSAGHEYLRKTTETNRVFTDFFNMATFILPKAMLPPLPHNVARKLGYYFSP